MARQKVEIKAVNIEINGVTFKPGDRCIVMTTSTGRSSLYPGAYQGMRGENAVVDIDDSRTELQKDGKEYDYEYEYRAFPYAYFRSSYRYGTPEYRAEYEKWEREVEGARKSGIAKLREGYEYVKIPFTRRSYLQNNNIYPSDLALKDFQL